MHKISEPASTSLVTRGLDVIDRAHARTAMRVHDVRNDILTTLERGIDRLEAVLASARKGIKRVDAASADAVNHAQGLVGKAIEKARLARSTPAHVAS